MCIIYKSVDDFENIELFLVVTSFFGDIHKYDKEFINIKNEFIASNYELYNLQSTQDFSIPF